MATASKSTLNHLDRTATEPRDKTLHKVTIYQITQINSSIRLIRLQPLSLDPPIKFLPGQWLDVHIPNLTKAGGFTITSLPSALLPLPNSPLPYLELAIQKSPYQHAAWLWGEEEEILGQELEIRVGGGFVWPPIGIERERIKRVVFVAGGVGINPLMSMVSAVAEEKRKGEVKGVAVRFLYSVKIPEGGIEGLEVSDSRREERREYEEILFLPRLLEIQKKMGTEMELELFLTSGEVSYENSERGDQAVLSVQEARVKVALRRIGEDDLIHALGPVEERGRTVCYICGVPSMTDELVDKAKKAEGMVESNVLFEKWW